jgi:hypothetical protein
VPNGITQGPVSCESDQVNPSRILVPVGPLENQQNIRSAQQQNQQISKSANQSESAKHQIRIRKAKRQGPPLRPEALAQNY